MRRTFILLSFLIVLVAPRNLRAQLVLADTLSTENLIMTLFGSGVDVVLDTIICDTAVAIREFDGFNTDLDLTHGLLMSTGPADSAIGPNLYPNGTSPVFLAQLGMPGYGPLTALAGTQTNDACIIEFDITPYCDSIGIRYVFASDEYNEFVNSINDIFAFFISGPGFSPVLPGDNIALVPGTTLPVAIDNVNNGPAGLGPCTNCAYYFDNAGGLTVEYDGFTIPLVAGARVQPCETYHITIAIADAVDQIYDSGVFLEVGGITCLTPTIEIDARHSDVRDSSVVAEGCLNSFGEFVFTLTQPSFTADTFYFQVGGTATSGVDYSPIVDSVIFLPGETEVVIPVTIFADNLPEGTETIRLLYVDSTLCATSIFVDSAVLEIVDLPLNLVPLADTSTCSGIGVPIGVVADTTPQTYIWTPSDFLSDSSLGMPILIPPNAGSYPDTIEYNLFVDALEGVCLYEDSLQVIVNEGNYATAFADTVCQGNPNTFVALSSTLPITSYEWDFGDTNTSTASNPSHTYATGGIFNATLITDNGECEDTVQLAVRVDTLPVVSFLADTVCEGDLTSFTNLGDSAYSYAWIFGDFTFSTLYAPTHTYATPGVFNATLIAQTQEGCIDSLITPVLVNSFPTALFSTATSCENDSAIFTNQSTPAANLTYLWDFGDGTTSTDQNPRHLYLSGPGIYTVQLLTTGPGGCQDSITQQIAILESPVAGLIPDSVCLGSSSSFTNASTASITILSEWDFGDGASSTQINPIHTYTDTGSFVVSLIASLDNGCTDTAQGIALVYENPEANFVADSVCLNFPTQFTSTTTQGTATTLNFDWNLGDGSTTIGNAPTYTYADPGTFTVELIASDNLGCADTINLPVEVYTPPVADFAIQDGCTNEDITVENLSTPGSDPSLNYGWDLDAGQISSEIVPVPVYPTPGLYDVSLIVVDDNGCADTTGNQVSLFLKPTADFSVDPVCFNETSSFQNLSIPNTGLAYSWTFGDGGTSDELSPSNFYDNPGTYNIELIIGTTDGCSDTISGTAEVYQLPVAEFEAADVCLNEATTYTNLSLNGSGTLLDYNWTFGDGNASDVEGPSNLYDNFGLFESRLIIIDEFGCSDTFSAENWVYALPVSDFTVDTACTGQIISLSNNSTIADQTRITDYAWDFGDGGTSLTEEPSKRYEDPGTYSITLETETNQGCRDTLIQDIEVNASPEAFFEYESVCFLDTANFINLSTINDSTGDFIRNWTWDWGDGTSTGSLPNPGHLYFAPGSYFVSLDLTSDKGCSASITRGLDIFELPDAPFVQADTVCFGDQAFLLAAPASPSDRIDWYTDIDEETPFLTSRTYLTPAVTSPETFWVQTTNSDGCLSPRVPVWTYLYNLEPPKIIVTDSVLIRPQAIVEFDLAGTGIWDTYFWTFGDGNTSTQSNPVHEYGAPGRYIIEVDLSDINNCEQSAQTVIEVKEPINIWVPSAFSPNGDQNNDEFFIQTELIQSLQFTVFNRWGQEVYSTETLSFRWNGRSNTGTPLNEGVYVYQLRTIDINGDDRVQTGTITLLK